MSENVNFHMTFPPTPAYIGCLLKIADGRVRTVAEIAEETGCKFIDENKIVTDAWNSMSKNRVLSGYFVTWGCLILRILRELLLVKSYI